MNEATSTLRDPEATRDRLIRAGFQLFGAEGYAAVTTRRLAAQAGTNVAAIGYHFGGKSGLHEACAHALASSISQVVGPPRDHGDVAPSEARRRLETMLRDLAHFLTESREAQDMVGFLLREMAGSEATVDLLYGAFIGPKHRELCALWGAATGQDPESEEVRLAVFAVLGQVVYFRIAQPFVLRRMDWDAIGPDEGLRIADVLADHLQAALDRGSR
ncbi:CerR family C-terminal domain-containing protein [Salipiger mucosus]|uniref:Transcriptional regulator, TetR family n=1 Tax=Salipiger mucosus DSM 16094 TaxID=1123237 RepID=S9QDW8_9RHOB|nr:CerR family C-terminal domain-containing protein [Salipiger mucosus]EPX79606.1 transcriptional regulator, TetR family [Salipiger mucosus DSM 16094]